MKWFIKIFLPSFGLCENKLVTEKQAIVFMRYLKNIKYDECCVEYTDIVNGNKISLQDSI